MTDWSVGEYERTAASASRCSTSLAGWVREGALAKAGAATARARAAAEPVALAAPPTPGRPPVDWGDETAVRALFAPHPSPSPSRPRKCSSRRVRRRSFLREQADHHPLWLDTRTVIGEEAFAGLLQRHLTAFRAANEDPAAFRITSRYLITTVVHNL